MPDTKYFKEYPEFTPNLTPKEIFKMGAFGGTYFRTIQSNVTGKTHYAKNSIKNYPKSWFLGINIESHVTSSIYNVDINIYKVKCGSTLQEWEDNGWIIEQDPYGWFQWYCNFYKGRRSKDDKRQIQRWVDLAGPTGRFRRRLMNLIIKNKKRYNDESISPVIRQVLLHWAYELTSEDLQKYKSLIK